MLVDEFREKIIGLKPSNFMAMNGASQGIIGGSNAPSDVLAQLQRAAIEFTHAYKTADTDELIAARKSLTGKLMVAVTLGAVTENRADDLLDDIAELMKERKV